MLLSTLPRSLAFSAIHYMRMRTAVPISERNHGIPIQRELCPANQQRAVNGLPNVSTRQLPTEHLRGRSALPPPEDVTSWSPGGNVRAAGKQANLDDRPRLVPFRRKLNARRYCAPSRQEARKISRQVRGARPTAENERKHAVLQ